MIDIYIYIGERMNFNAYCLVNIYNIKKNLLVTFYCCNLYANINTSQEIKIKIVSLFFP